MNAPMIAALMGQRFTERQTRNAKLKSDREAGRMPVISAHLSSPPLIATPRATTQIITSKPVSQGVTPMSTAFASPASIDAIPLAFNHPSLVAELKARGASVGEAVAKILAAEGERQSYHSAADAGAASIRASSAGDDANVIATAQGVELAKRVAIYRSKVRGEGRKISIHQAINELEILGK